MCLSNSRPGIADGVLDTRAHCSSSDCVVLVCPPAGASAGTCPDSLGKSQGGWMALSSQPCAPTALLEEGMCGSSAARTWPGCQGKDGAHCYLSVPFGRWVMGGPWGRCSSWQGLSSCLFQASLLQLQGCPPGGDRSANCSPNVLCQLRSPEELLG